MKFITIMTIVLLTGSISGTTLANDSNTLAKKSESIITPAMKEWVTKNKGTIKTKISELAIRKPKKWKTLYETGKKLILSAEITKKVTSNE